MTIAESRTGYASSDGLHFRIAFAVLPVVTGGTIPVFGLVNLIWGSVFGFPGSVFHWLRIPHPLQVDLLGTLVWPIVAVWLLGRLGGWVSTLSRPPRYACIVAFILSFFAVAPVERIVYADPNGDFAYASFPLFVRLLIY